MIFMFLMYLYRPNTRRKGSEAVITPERAGGSCSGDTGCDLSRSLRPVYVAVWVCSVQQYRPEKGAGLPRPRRSALFSGRNVPNFLVRLDVLSQNSNEQQQSKRGMTKGGATFLA